MDMITIITGGQPAEFYCDGQRVKQGPFFVLMDKAYDNGTLTRLPDRREELPNGLFRITYHSVIRDTPTT